jgi:hypothetical protein
VRWVLHHWRWVLRLWRLPPSIPVTATNTLPGQIRVREDEPILLGLLMIMKGPAFQSGRH